MKNIFLFLVLLLIVGCAEKVCNLADWQAAGEAVAAVSSSPVIPEDLIASCQVQKAKPDEVAFQRGYALEKEKQCSNLQGVFSVGMQGRVGILNKCGDCATKEAEHICWQASIHGGAFSNTAARRNEIREMLDFQSRRVEECSAQIASMERINVSSSDALMVELKSGCAALQASLAAMEQYALRPIEQEMLNHTRDCMTIFKDKSTEVFEYCRTAHDERVLLLGEPMQKTAGKALGRKDLLTIEKRCNNPAESFRLGMQTNIQTINDCNECPTKASVSACWQARVEGGQVAAAAVRWTEADGLVDYLRRDINECKARLKTMGADRFADSDPVFAQARTFCGEMELNLRVLERSYLDPMRSAMLSRYAGCAASYKDKSPDLAHYCESEHARLVLEDKQKEPEDGGERMLNFSQ